MMGYLFMAKALKCKQLYEPNAIMWANEIAKRYITKIDKQVVQTHC